MTVVVGVLIGGLVLFNLFVRELVDDQPIERDGVEWQ